MSFQAMTWAVSQETENAGQKLVLLMLSNHTNGHTGQCNPSHKLLAQECCMGISTLKNHITKLAELGFLKIIHKSVDGVSLPNHYLLNFGGVGQNLADGGSESDGGVGQNLATNQEDKPVKEPVKTHSAFDDFWQAYPNKKAKHAAQQVFNRLNPDSDLVETMICAIANQKRSEQWKRGFIPMPSTWLNGKRWEDEISNVIPRNDPTEPLWRQEQRLRIQQAVPSIAARKSSPTFDIEANNGTTALLGKSNIR